MINYQDFFKSSIEKFKQENRYREFVDISRICGRFPYAIDNSNDQEVIVWCSNDYLGMSQNENSINNAIASIKKYGLGSGGTRNISGNNHEIVKLEQELAKLHDKERGIVFSSGYVCNDSVIQSLVKIIPDLLIFSDRNNHASIISGIRNSGAEKFIFNHNDANHLEKLLKSCPIERPKLIIFESIYSMDGDFGEVESFVKLAKKYNALTYCDEVHGVGLYGEKGQGVCAEIGLSDEVDIIQGTFGKAYGVIGGFIVGKNELVDAVKLNSSGFIFSTSIPPVVAGAIRSNMASLENNNKLRIDHKNKVLCLKKALNDAGIEIVANKSHIVSIKVSGASKVENISKRLLVDFKIYIQHINYPTVKKGDERLRITVTPFHTQKMIDELVSALKECI